MLQPIPGLTETELSDLHLEQVSSGKGPVVISGPGGIYGPVGTVATYRAFREPPYGYPGRPTPVGRVRF
jgi:hypothetical protein